MGSSVNKLHLSLDAQKDLAGIKKYIAEELENPQAALATVTRITKEIRMLCNYAALGTPLASIAQTDEDYRYLVSGNYMVFYRTDGSDIYIDRVLYGRSNYLRDLLADKQPDAANPYTKYPLS